MATLEEQAAILAQVNRDLAEFGAVTETTAARLAEMNQQLTKAARAQKRYEQAMEDLGKTVGQTVLDAGKTAKQGSSMYNGALSAGAEAIDSFASKFGPWGRLIGASFQVTAKYLQAVNQQSDKLYDGFKELSRSGAIASDGMTGLFEGLQKTGMGVDQLNKYLALLQENNKDLALYGGTVFEGRRRFEDLSKTMEPVREQFMNLGMSQEEQNAAIAGYIRLQARLGRAQTLSTDELAVSAKKYMLEQDALTKLTGSTRQEQEQQQERAMQEEQYAAKIRQLELSGQQGAVDRLNSLNKMLEETSPDLARAFRASITGNLSNVDAQKLNMSTQGKAIQDIKKVIDGTMQPVEAADSISRAVGKTADKIGTTLGQFSAFNDSFINFSVSQKARIKAENNQTEQLKKIYDDQNKTLAGLGDATTQAKASMEKAFQTITLATDAFVNLAITPVTKAMAALTRGLAGLYKLLPGGPDFFAPGETPAGTYSRSPQTAAAQRAGPAAPATSAPPAARPAAPVAPAAPATSAPSPTTTTAAPNPSRAGVTAMPPVPPRSTASEGELGAKPPNNAAPSKPLLAPRSSPTMSEDEIKKMIAHHEGTRYRPYQDSLGLWTVGIGHLIGDGKSLPPEWNREFSKEEVQSMFEKDYAHHRAGAAANTPNFDKMTSAMQGAFTDLAFNMGPNWIKAKGFKTLEKELKNFNTDGVVASLTNSKWAKQVGERAGHITGLINSSGFLQAKDGGMFNGPQTGYPMTLHGPEAVIPLKDGMVPVSMQDNGITDSIKQLIAQMSTTTKTPEDNASMNERLISVLGDLVRGQNQLISTSEQMLRVAAN